MLSFILRHPIAMLAALVLHAVLITGLMFSSFDDYEVIKINMDAGESKPQAMPVKQTEPMKTFTVDAEQVKLQLAKIQQEEDAKLRAQRALEQKSAAEKRRLAELKRKQAEEKRKADAERKKALAEKRKADEAKRLAKIEEQKVVAQKQRALEEQRKADKAKKEAAQAEKKREEAKRKVAEAEKQRKAEEAKRKKLEAEIKKRDAEKKRLEQEALTARLQKEQEEEEAALQRQLAAEEAKKRQAAKAREMKSLRETYISSIAASVKDSWKTAAKVSDQARCVLSITQTPKGMISSVKVEECNKFANKQFKKDAKRAVYRAEPLPPPPVKELFERNVRFVFKP